MIQRTHFPLISIVQTITLYVQAFCKNVRKLVLFAVNKSSYLIQLYGATCIYGQKVQYYWETSVLQTMSPSLFMGDAVWNICSMDVQWGRAPFWNIDNFWKSTWWHTIIKVIKIIRRQGRRLIWQRWLILFSRRQRRKTLLQKSFFWRHQRGFFPVLHYFIPQEYFNMAVIFNFCFA